MIRAVVFGFDGTILDTETPAYEAWRSVFQDHGVDLPLSIWAKHVGSSNPSFKPFEYLQMQTRRSLDRATVQKERRRRNRVLLAEKTPLPGVVEWLNEAGGKGLRCGIASSSPREWIVPLLERTSLSRFFSVIVAEEDVSSTKPDPAVYHLVASKLGVLPEEVVAVEDTSNGVCASIAAGMLTVAVPNKMTATQDFAAAHVILMSLADETIDQVLSTAPDKGMQRTPCR